MVLYANQIIDPYYGWPIDQNELEAQLISNFGSVVAAQATIHHYEKHTNVIVTKNYQVSLNTYVSLIDTSVIAVDGSMVLPTIDNPVIQTGSNTMVSFPDGSIVDTSVQLYAISNYQAYINQNEANRNIQLVQNQFANEIDIELQQLLSQ